MLLRPFAFGSVIGLVLAYVFYNTIPAYTAFIDWQFAHPLVFFVGLPVGVALAVFTD
jgi:hypothetical protein